MIGASPPWKNIVLEATDSGDKNSVLWSCCVRRRERDRSGVLPAAGECGRWLGVRGGSERQRSGPGQEGPAGASPGLETLARVSAAHRAGAGPRAGLGCDRLRAVAARRVLCRGRRGSEQSRAAAAGQAQPCVVVGTLPVVPETGLRGMVKPSCDTQTGPAGNKLVGGRGLSPQAGCLREGAPLPAARPEQPEVCSRGDPKAAGEAQLAL